MSQSLDSILKVINDSLVATNDSLENLSEKVENPDLPALIDDLLVKTSQSLPEGVSLLDLKNNSMLSYINNLALIILSRIEGLKTNGSEDLVKLKDSGVKGTIVQRVVLERGVKNLEKKLTYQLDKMVRNYKKMENDSSEQAVLKKQDQEGQGQGQGEQDSEDEDEDEDEDSEDELNFRPDASSLVKDLQKRSEPKRSSRESDKPSTEKYRPPKISAALPPSDFREKQAGPSQKGTKLQAMEEYLAETGDAPLTEQSIGSNILDSGRGGVQTLRDRKKQEEVKQFEESNFTRLSTTMSKKEKKNKRRHEGDTFFGEDWGLFKNSRTDMNTSRSSKPKSAWDRAKKRRT